MWYLNFIPDTWLIWFIHGVLALGFVLSIIGAIGKHIPFVSTYALFVKLLGGLLLVMGIYFEGGYGVEMSYRARIAEMQAEVKLAEEKSKVVNTVIETKLVEKVKVIKEKVNENSHDIETNRAAINAECKLSDTAWLLYNRASQNDLAGSTSKSN